MTIKAYFLNRSNHSTLVPIFYAVGNALVVASLFPASAIAQDAPLNSLETLPPPPSISASGAVSKSQQNIDYSLRANNNSREYIFSVPNSDLSVKQQSVYKVQVFGDNSNILGQVRELEPKAFLQGNVIQVGIFSEQDNAVTMLRKLALQGLWARIVVE